MGILEYSELRTIDETGDTKITWNHWDKDSVAKAKKQFDELIAKSYRAFKMEGFMGTKGEQINEFDPGLERILMIPRMVGG